MPILDQLGHALMMSLGMMWQTGWTLVLGFTVSAVLQTVVPAEQMRDALGRGGAKDLTAATALGAASSSCSYASAAIMRTLFKKGAALNTSLAFLFSSTNLVLELGIVLYVLMGWQFTAGEWIGGVVMVVVMSVLLQNGPSRAPDRGCAVARGGGLGPPPHVHDGRGLDVVGPPAQARSAGPRGAELRHGTVHALQGPPDRLRRRGAARHLRAGRVVESHFLAGRLAMDQSAF